MYKRQLDKIMEADGSSSARLASQGSCQCKRSFHSLFRLVKALRTCTTTRTATGQPNACRCFCCFSSFSKPLTPQTNGQRPVPKAVYACIIGTCPCSKNPLIWTEEPVHFPTNIQRSKPRWTLHALYTFRVLFLHHQILLVCILTIHNGPGYPFLIDLFGRWKLLYFFWGTMRERKKSLTKRNLVQRNWHFNQKCCF